MCDEWKEYVNDPRTICKYGSKCYQKNPQHHITYKHPPRNLKNNQEKRTKHRYSPYSRDEKQNKKGNNDTKQETSKVLNNVPEEESTANVTVEQSFENKDSERESKTAVNLEQEEEVSETEKDPSPSKNLELKVEKCSITIQDNITFYDPTTSHSILKELFLVEMPADFFKLYECLNNNNAFENTLSSVNLEAIGPFDLLLGKLPILDDKELYLSHWRFFYDPPEFQAVLKKKGKSEYHIGYFRDVPSENPVFLASNDSAKDCHITPMAENIFGAVYLYLQNEKKTSPFTAMVCQKLMDKLKTYAEQNNYSLEEFNVKKRLSQVVTKTFHGAGIVVPYNKKTQLGYRPNIKKLFAKFQAAKTESEKDSVLSEIQPIITYASIALDECDFGTGVEAGIDLFCSGLKELEPPALSSLT
ncbi:UPF0609 protein, partial [Operophtera brumata]